MNVVQCMITARGLGFNVMNRVCSLFAKYRVSVLRYLKLKSLDESPANEPAYPWVQV